MDFAARLFFRTLVSFVAWFVPSDAYPFCCFLRKTLHAFSGSRGAAGRSLFPLPFPKLGIFESFSPRSSSRKRKRLEFDRAFHVVVCALNFLHADCSFVPLDLMLKEPSDQQQTALRNLRSLLKAFGSSARWFFFSPAEWPSFHPFAGRSIGLVPFHDLSRVIFGSLPSWFRWWW